MTAKGIYVEALSNALITGVTMDHVGFYGAGAAVRRPGRRSVRLGIDINLKYGDLHDVTITDFDSHRHRRSNGDGRRTTTRRAISVKTRDDAPSYGTPRRRPGRRRVVISNGTIDGTSTGIRVGETKQDNVAGPMCAAERDIAAPRSPTSPTSPIP